MKVLAERFRAEELVRDQYSGRYPFELIQNASDAVAETGGAHAKVCFALTDTALIVADQGDGFGAEQVEAISGFASSSKDPRKTIGYKGLGFKSVNDITLAPQIFSPTVQFGFDDQRARRLVHEVVGGEIEELQIPHYRFPFEISLEEAGPDSDKVRALKNEYTTVIRLPFRKEVTRPEVEEALLSTLDARLLLFLDRLETLELRGTSGDFSASIDRDVGPDCTEVLLESSGDVEHFLLYSAVKPIRDHSLVAALGGAWQQVDRVRVYAAVPLSDNLPNFESSEPLHVYFPTEVEIGLPIVLCADFQMEFDRRRIANTPKALPYNEWLMGELADFVASEVVTSLVERFHGHPRVAQSVTYPESAEKWSRLLRQSFIERLADVEFVPCVDGTVRTPSEAEFLPELVPDAAYLQTLLPELTDLVHPDLENDSAARDFLTTYLGASQLEADVLEHLQLPRAIDVERFYRFLLKWWESANWSLERALKETTCVRVIDGRWVKPTDALMPPQRSEIEFPPGLTVPVADLPAIDELEDLLESAGLRSFEWRIVIANHLMPVLRSESEPVETFTSAMTALRHYFEAGGSDARVRDDVADTLLAVRDADGTAVTRIRACNAYFADDWIPDSTAHALFAESGEAEFLAVPPPDDSDERASDIRFYKWLGVEDKPRIYDEYGGAGTSSVPDHAEIQDWGLRWRWNVSEQYSEAGGCAQGHTRSQNLVRSPWIDRLDTLIDSAEAEKLTTLWRVFTENWDYYEKAMNAQFHCSNSKHIGDPDRRFPSLAAWLLHNTQWVLGLQQDGVVLDVPANVWTLSDNTPASLQQAVVVLAETLDPAPRNMLRFLGIVDSTRPLASDLVALLRDLADSENASEDVQTIARWAMRMLDAVAESINSQDLEQIPLLSTLDGHPVFDVHPYVTANRLTAQTWKDRFPLFDGDRRSRDLIAALGLPNLDSVMRTKPVTGDRDAAAEVDIIDAIDEAKPYLLAVAASVARSEQDQISRALNGLTAVCSGRLALEYQFEAERRQAHDLTVFIEHERGEHIPSRGTAYFAPDPVGGIDWLTLGPQLAEYLHCNELADSFALILSNGELIRRRYLESRGLTETDIAAAAEVLRAHPSDRRRGRPVDDDADQLAELIEFDEATDNPISDTQQERAADHQQKSHLTATDARIEGRDRDRTLGDEEGLPRPASDDPSDDGIALVDERQQFPWQGLGLEARGATPVEQHVEVGEHDTLAERQSRFFTYVVPADASSEERSPKSMRNRSEIDAKGIEHVVTFELAADRWPEVQPHSNPGFDIESHYEDGSVARIIEVKSISGPWGAKGVTLSKRQLLENQSRDDSFWLYVVEYATDPAHSRVIPIHNPFKHSGSFVFDGGWAALREDQH